MARRGPKAALGKGPIEAVDGKPKCPAHLDAIGKAKWKETVASLESLGILSKTDSGVIEQHAALYSRWRRAQEVIDSGELTFITSSGMRRPIPEVEMANMCSKQMLMLESAMCLTPASRAKLTIAKDQPIEEEWKDFA
jgi:P27 family predicted phage terminase small subunit